MVLVLMALADVLTRLVVIYLRGRRLAADRDGRPILRQAVSAPVTSGGFAYLAPTFAKRRW
jgi:hypothetical protein